MTINEYFTQGQSMKRNVERLADRVQALHSRVLNPGSPINGNPTGHRNDNGHETRLVEYLDASKEFKEAYEEYMKYHDDMKKAKDNVLHWQALVFERVYETNVFFEYSDALYGVGTILDTNDRKEIQAKFDEAKAAVVDQLRLQGVELD